MSKIRITFATAVALALAGCGSRVPAGKMGLTWRPFSSGLSRKPVPHGFYWHLPWNDIIVYSVQWRSYVEQIDILTRDDTHLRIEASVLVRPLPAELYQLHSEIGPEFYDNAVKAQFLTVVRATLAGYDMESIPARSVEIENRVRDRLRARLAGKHLALDSVAIRHVDFPPAVAQAASSKLAKDQTLMQKVRDLEIAAKDADIARVKATSDAETQLIRARGDAEKAKIRAAGEAEAQRLVSATLTPLLLHLTALTSGNAKLIYVPFGKGAPGLHVGGDE